jgi:hypothetical protein
MELLGVVVVVVVVVHLQVLGWRTVSGVLRSEQGA